MSVILILIIASLTMALLFLGGFIWSVRSGQYEDTSTPSMRVLLDDPNLREKPANRNPTAPASRPRNPNDCGANKLDSMKKITGEFGSTAAIAATILLSAAASAIGGDSWKDKTIAPVANPLYFEDPRIYTEVRPVFMDHSLPNTFDYNGGSLPLGGEVRVYAAQIRLKLTDRLALIATKDGYIEFRPNNTLSHQYGWADLAAGLKYALIDDEAKQLIVTPGFTVTLPTGNQDVFQGHGAGEENVFVSAEKGWDNFHLTGNLGVRIPNDFDKQTAQLHYSVQADYFVHQYFIPFFVANGYTILTDGKDQGSQSLNAVPLNAEGYDLINFGASAASGSTQFTIGGGARSKLTKNVDLGVAYEVGVVNPKGIFDSRVTADVSLHF